MECPYCKKDVYGMTGFQEAQKFQKHLRKCKKNPRNQTVVDPGGEIRKQQHNPDLLEALNIRAASGQ